MTMKLTRFEDDWAQAALGAMFPGSREHGFADIGRMDVRGFLAEAMRTLPFKAALGLRLAVWLVALAPVVVLHRFTTIRGLGPLDRERVLAALAASRTYAVRSLAMVLKTLGAMLYAGDDSIRARLHFRAAANHDHALALQGSPVAMSSAEPLVALRLRRTPARVT
jgi:hypothetical protein